MQIGIRYGITSLILSVVALFGCCFIVVMIDCGKECGLQHGSVLEQRVENHHYQDF